MHTLQFGAISIFLHVLNDEVEIVVVTHSHCERFFSNFYISAPSAIRVGKLSLMNVTSVNRSECFMKELTSRANTLYITTLCLMYDLLPLSPFPFSYPNKTRFMSLTSRVTCTGIYQGLATSTQCRALFSSPSASHYCGASYYAKLVN